ncbi:MULTISPECIES: helix-turn-helix domain-containing protein [Flavobacteriaceae]|uniref:AraC family transcriptional regulator n=2 Tax=Flavobacteriaceae TaxID=49546 RepID=A0A4Y8ANV6_9FLAO|nr:MULTISPECIES: AraC family transcriptional regulator [Flavobacteriaceae]TEW72141.1 AraC family transcriptional regulator [Gramella jeungdoensis]GGK56694.1 AraC family transcriptional regulator [Lutibacter litoralis]
MKSSLKNYKYIDKSTQMLFNEKDTFKVFYFNNLSSDTELYEYPLNNNYIQIYFCNTNTCTVAFNFEHCAANLEAGNSSMVYFKDEKMNILFNIPPKSELIAVLISIEYFHSLFSVEGNFLFNFNGFKVGKPIIEPKQISPTIQIILNQLTSKQITKALRPVFIKGKVYELLSYYFNTANENETEKENCPYIANEETVIKIKHAKEIIIEEMINPPSLDDLAKKVGLNIKKLKTDFKDFYGVPVFTFLLNYKMELAKKLLQEQQLNVNEIAAQLGYSASSHFIAAFKRKYKTTPKQYAKS